VTNYYLLFIIITIFVIIFLFCKLLSKLVTIVTSNFWSLKFVVNEQFSCSDDYCNNGGDLMDKEPAIVRVLISNMAENCQQFNSAQMSFRQVHVTLEIDIQLLKNKLAHLTSLVWQLAMN